MNFAKIPLNTYTHTDHPKEKRNLDCVANGFEWKCAIAIE